MASGKIKGITIEFDGNTTKLGKALKDVDKKTRDLDKELKQVNNALKFNPTNVELWRQKQQLLSDKVSETKRRLDALKAAQREMDTAGVDRSSAEYRELQREIITTESKLKNFEGQLREVGNANLKALSEQFKDVGGKIEGVGRSLTGVSTAAAGVVAGLGAAAYKAGQAADDLNTLSKVTGIGTEELQKYGYAADLVDVSVEAIAKSNKKLTKNAYAAANGSKSQAEAFKAIGVSVTDANGNLRDSEDIFQDVITNLGKMTNETERDALAQQLMGKSAAELNPLIEDGGKTYKMVSDTLKKYDLDYVDQETLDKANEFNDQLDTMKLIGTVAFANISSQLAGYLAPALEKVVDLVGRFANWLSQLDPAVLTVIGTIAGFVAILAPLLIGIGKVATGISSIINLVNLVGGATTALSAGPLLGIIAAVAAVIAIGVLLYKNWDKIKAAAKALGDKIKNVWTSIKTATTNAWNSVKNAITAPFTAAYDKIKNIIKTIKGWFPIKLGKIFKGIKLPHFDVEWSYVKAFGRKINFPSGFDISWYKNGGIFDSPTIAGIGEAGPEAVVPLDKFWDKLDNMNTGEITINVYPSAGMNETELARKVEQALATVQRRRNLANGNI
ncbi:MAG: phage tail tape measure protein [Acutalibacteraceae bacterium]|nr:phage tail tape measure protein [Acutalibacteraceae bacterium]